MKLMDWFKAAFPKPHLPQKRYVVLFFVLAYPALHAYVQHTKADWDDKILDAVRSVVISSFSSPDAPSDQYDDNGMRFGEGET